MTMTWMNASQHWCISFSYFKQIKLTGGGSLSDTYMHRHLEISVVAPVPTTVLHLQSSHSYFETTGIAPFKYYCCSIYGSLWLPHTRATHPTPLCFSRVLTVTCDGDLSSNKSCYLLMIHIETGNTFERNKFTSKLCPTWSWLTTVTNKVYVFSCKFQINIELLEIWLLPLVTDKQKRVATSFPKSISTAHQKFVSNCHIFYCHVEEF